MSVVVAVLIDSFTTATEREKEKERSITWGIGAGVRGPDSQTRGTEVRGGKRRGRKRSWQRGAREGGRSRETDRDRELHFTKEAKARSRCPGDIKVGGKEGGEGECNRQKQVEGGDATQRRRSPLPRFFPTSCLFSSPIRRLAFLFPFMGLAASDIEAVKRYTEWEG
jgi:hypothetical protein